MTTIVNWLLGRETEFDPGRNSSVGLLILRVFLGLKDIHQVFVIDCIDKGMTYRGEDMQMYTEIAKQYEIMWKDPEAYKEKASKHLRRWE